MSSPSFYSSKLPMLTDPLYESFENAPGEEERIRLLYPRLRCFSISSKIYGKSMEDALKGRADGNAFFVKNDCDSALNCYSDGVLKCPQNSPESREILAILVANRSACLYDLKEYEATLSDISYVGHLNFYPEHLKFKLFYREAKCYSYIPSKMHLAAASYELALDHLDLSTLDKKAIDKKKLEIRSALKSLENFKQKDIQTNIDNFKSNPLYPSVSASIMFDFEPDLGRFARAASDVDVGEIIAQEKAHCVVLKLKFSLTNCQYCTKSTVAPIPCEKCADVCFCSLDCRSSAAIYHRYECGLHQTLSKSQASIIDLMALRIITQTSIGHLESVIKNIGSPPKVYTYNNYACVYSLCRNEHLRNTKQHFYYAVNAIYWLRLLKTSTYFGLTTQDDKLTDEEVFACKLILRNLEMLKFNAHKIYEVQETPPGPLDSQNMRNFRMIGVGGGLYPTLALFNHSCDPYTVRFNIGPKMIVRMARPVKKGEVIYDNYGPIYTHSPIEERRQFLAKEYYFTCHCRACDENWALFKEIGDKVKIPCKNTNCSNFFSLDDKPLVGCTSCNTVTNLFSHLKARADLENVLLEAEGAYKRNHYQEALELYLNAMRFYSKNTVPSVLNWTKLEHRLIVCFSSFGSRCSNYAKIKKNEE